MHVAELWMHPVKSMQGVSVLQADIEADGLHGDRLWGVRDNESGKVLTGRREPRLLLASATNDAGTPVVTLPDGAVLAGLGDETDAALTKWLGKSVSLVDARQEPPSEAQFFADATDDTSDVITWTMPEGRFVDALPLLIITTASLRAAAKLHPDGAWDVRRFRPNIVIDVDGDDFVEDGWIRQAVHTGEAVVQPVGPCARCTMVTRPQPGLERDLDVFKTLARAHNATYGVWTRVVSPGAVRVGDAVEVQSA